MKKIFTLIAIALGVIAIYSCGGDTPTPTPPVIIKPEPVKPDPPKEPVLSIVQTPEIVPWGQSAKITISSQNAKFRWNGDSVTTASFELKYLLKDTTFNIEAKGYKTISKSHTVSVSTPSEYEKLIVGSWRWIGDDTHRPYDPDDLSKGHYWTGFVAYTDSFALCRDIDHFAVHKQMRIEFPCLADDGGSFIWGGGINPYRYFIGTDSVGRPTLVQGTPEAPALSPALIHYAEVIEKLTKDTMIIYQEIKPHALVTGWRTWKRYYVRVSDKPYAFSEEEGGVGAGSRLKSTNQKPPSYAYKEGVGVVRIN